MLRQEDGECKVGDLVPEGPAAKSGRITNDDIITAVALILAILLFGYLVLTLLFPEKF